MSDTAQKIITFFSDRFLNVKKTPEKISDILDLSIQYLRDFDNRIIKSLNSQGIKTIKDLTQLNDEDLKSLIKKHKFDSRILKNALVGANLISNAWNKRSVYLKKVQSKVVIVGLDSAGKTTLINRLINDFNYSDIVNLEPTIGVNVEEYQTNKLNLVIWDLGGQKAHIDEYLEEPEKFFIQLDVLIFVIDTQDDKRYGMAINYLRDILNILEYLKEYPYLLIMMNKADSDVMKDPDFQIKLEYLRDIISNLITNRDNNWLFEILQTSLYNFFSTEPVIVKDIKTIFSPQQNATQSDSAIDNSKSKDIDDKLQKILDINLKLMDKVAIELSEVRRVLSSFNRSNLPGSLDSIPFEKTTDKYMKNSVQKQVAKVQKVKKTQKARKRKKKSSGPPKRIGVLPQIPTVVAQEKTTEGVQENLTGDAQMIPKPQILNPPRAPPPSIPKTIPPNPKFPEKPPPRNAYLVDNIISELKAVFNKRGVTD